MKNILCVFCCALALFACKGKAKQEEPPPEYGDISTLNLWGRAVQERFGGSAITVGMAAHNATDAMKNMAEQFTDLSGISVKWDVVEETNLKTKQLLDAQGRGAYDVLMVDAFWMNEWVAKNVIESLAPYIKSGNTPPWFGYEDIMPAYRNGISAVQGEPYGIPVSGETRLIAYRKDLFDEYGKQPPKTMDEFLSLAQFFNGREDGLYGVAMRAQRGIHFASGWMSLMYNFGGGFVDQGTIGTDNINITLDTPETIASLQFYVDLLQNAPPDVATYTHEEALGAFIAGKTAMWLDATALLGQITNPDISRVADQVGFVPTPEGPAGGGAALAGWSLAIPVKSAQKEQAWAFIVFMAGREKAAEYVRLGGAPTRESVFSNASLRAADPALYAHQPALEAANQLVEKGLSWVPQMREVTQILEIAGAYGSSALAGDISAEEAAKEAQTDIEDLLK